MLFVPSGATRVSAPEAISTRITEPSAQATGPSGNCSPSVTVLMSSGRMSISPPGSAGRGRHLRPIPFVEIAPEIAAGQPGELVAFDAQRLFEARLVTGF